LIIHAARGEAAGIAVSDDLRERVVEAVLLGGLSCNQAAARFKVSIASAVRWVKRFRTSGEISPAPSGGEAHCGFRRFKRRRRIQGFAVSSREG
jgi:hypothetical protein